MIVFTICARSSLAYGLTLHESLKRHHPEALFHIALCDSDKGIENGSYPFSLLRLEELGLPDLESMVVRYSGAELSAAIKPLVFQLLFDRHPGETVLYLDPHAYVLSRFDEMLELTAEGSACILTPSILEPAEFAEFDDQQFLRYGAYNLGFCSLADTAQVRRVVWWWARRLERSCVVDLPAGLFLDQKWADLFPAFIEGTRILRHPGYNVAYWNLQQRRLSSSGGQWSVNGHPLRFFQFNGVAVEDEKVLSRHSTLLDVRNVGAAAALLTEYKSAVVGHGHARYLSVPYAFSQEGVRASQAEFIPVGDNVESSSTTHDEI